MIDHNYVSLSLQIGCVPMTASMVQGFFICLHSNMNRLFGLRKFYTEVLKYDLCDFEFSLHYSKAWLHMGRKHKVKLDLRKLKT